MGITKLIDVNPFYPLIIKVHYDGFNWNELEPICQQMIDGAPQNSTVENSNGFSSVYNTNNQPHLHPVFEDFYKWLRPITDNIIYAQKQIVQNYTYAPAMSWVNVHNNGGVTLEHEHGAAVLVAATYLNLPNNSGFIEFKDPFEIQNGFLPRENDIHNWKQVEAETGDTLLFPGWLRHRTQPNTTFSDRWVLTTNFLGYTK